VNDTNRNQGWIFILSSTSLSVGGSGAFHRSFTVCWRSRDIEDLRTDTTNRPAKTDTMAYQQGQQQQQQQQQDNRNPNRLQLNFGFNNPPNFAAEQGRAFPTTPSTFPQPFPDARGNQDVWGTGQAASGINQQGYFYNNPSFQQYNNLSSPATPGAGAGGGGYRSPGGFNEVNGGLAHQFQHQNLGGNMPRSASPYQRGASPANARPRTAGQNGQVQYGSYLNAPMPSQPPQPSIYDEEPPPKNAEKYSTTITERVKLQKMLTQEFFKENVERARARNER